VDGGWNAKKDDFDEKQSGRHLSTGMAMVKLSVGTHTTPLELAEFFKRLEPGDTVAGKPGHDGAVVLYVNANAKEDRLQEELIAARVAVEVVLQPMENILGAEVALRHVRHAFDAPHAVRVDNIRGQLEVLADLYDKAVGAGLKLHAQGGQIHFIRGQDGSGVAAVEDLSAEQIRMVEALFDKLLALPRVPGKKS
jgi:hypothetical protein